MPHRAAMRYAEGRFLLALSIILLSWGLISVGFALGLSFSMVIFNLSKMQLINLTAFSLAVGGLMITGHVIYLAKSKS